MSWIPSKCKLTLWDKAARKFRIAYSEVTMMFVVQVNRGWWFGGWESIVPTFNTKEEAINSKKRHIENWVTQQTLTAEKE